MFFHIGYGKCQNKRISGADYSRWTFLNQFNLTVSIVIQDDGVVHLSSWKGCNPAAVQTVGANIMLTYQDCVELSDLTEDEIDAIARHERLPEMAALEMGSYLVHTRGVFR
jgi:hypothetical protein